MRLVLDVENTVTKRGGKTHMDPFEPNNFLVQVGTKNVDIPSERHLLTFDHVEYRDRTGANAKLLQTILDHTTLLIMHNAQHDLMWLWASGFKYNGEIYDTMLAEYILQRGQKQPLSLLACAERRELSFQKDDTLKKYFKEGYNTNEIPHEELTHYLGCDIDTTAELFLTLDEAYSEGEQDGMDRVRDITFRVCRTLTKMYMSGFRVDRLALEEVRKEFEQEKVNIEGRLFKQIRELMGDTPVNLNSPEQVSQVIFSRAVINKKEWVALFDFTNSLPDFKAAVEANSTLLRRTTAFSCPTCNGVGSRYKKKKDGSDFKKASKCPDCLARGYQLKQTNKLAGLGFYAPDKTWVSANGFSTSKGNLDILISTAKTRGMTIAIQFLEDIKRLSAITTYLSSFVEGINTYTKEDGFLHVGLTQHITSTGRFSGRNPNMQNMPRGGTFPVKRVFISRWEGGHILEADFAQLEFRVAAYLSQDAVAMKEIATGFDVHSYTAKVISDAGQPTTRQVAKGHTFAPLFGASGYGRSRAEAAYYKHFTEKYQGIAKWHRRLGDEAMRYGKITTPSGRQYAFPDVERRKNGTVTYFTMIKNYPVQGFATGDIVPVVLVEMDKRLDSLRSCLVNTVHDSTVIDVHPEEKDKVIQIIAVMNRDLDEIIEGAYDVKMNVPMLLEAKIGPNWLDTEDVSCIT
jgi:DNA polymerase I-like protein with 3'-5' exonuclease and polymerase domains